MLKIGLAIAAAWGLYALLGVVHFPALVETGALCGMVGLLAVSRV